jgi:hypothetical protein
MSVRALQSTGMSLDSSGHARCMEVVFRSDMTMADRAMAAVNQKSTGCAEGGRHRVT